MPEPIPRQLGAILGVLGLDWDSLFDPAKDGAGRDRERVVQWLYRALDTLDSKTGHLLRFASLLLAAQTFLAGIVRQTHPSELVSFAVLALVLVPLWAAFSALKIFEVRWPFFGNVVLDSTSNDPTAVYDQIKKEMFKLSGVCDERVQANRRTYRWCQLSAIGFLLTLAFALAAIGSS